MFPALEWLNDWVLAMTRLASQLLRLACASLMVVACAPSRHGADVNLSGFLLLGPNGAREFGLDQADTLFEQRGARIPPKVRIAAEQAASRLMSSAGCTRYFRRGELFVVLLVSECAQGIAAEDGEALAAFRSDGSGVGRVIGFATSDDYREVSPARRPQSSLSDS